MNIVSTVALFAPLSARLEILWQVCFYSFESIPSQDSYCGIQVVTVAVSLIQWMLGVLTCLVFGHGSVVIGLCCPGPQATVHYSVSLVQQSQTVGEPQLVYSVFFWPVTNKCALPPKEKTLSSMSRPNAVFVEQARLFTNCTVLFLRLLPFTFVFTTDTNSNPRLRELWNLTLMSHVRTLKPCFG